MYYIYTPPPTEDVRTQAREAWMQLRELGYAHSVVLGDQATPSRPVRTTGSRLILPQQLGFWSPNGSVGSNPTPDTSYS